MGTDEALSWLELKPAEIGPEVQVVFDRTQARIGHVRHGQRVLAHKPQVLLALENLGRALTQDEQIRLSPKERELIAIVVSIQNRCPPCIFGHAARLREITGDPVWVGTVEANHRHAALSLREKAITDFALKLTRTPGEVEEEDLAPLREAGLGEIEIYEVTAIVAYFNFTNRFNNGVGVHPNPESYLAHR